MIVATLAKNTYSFSVLRVFRDRNTACIVENDRKWKDWDGLRHAKTKIWTWAAIAATLLNDFTSWLKDRGNSSSDRFHATTWCLGLLLVVCGDWCCKLYLVFALSLNPWFFGWLIQPESRCQFTNFFCIRCLKMWGLGGSKDRNYLVHVW